ncbi:hypothetical protein Tsubulata_021218 [Turnera subulata]|uniref:Pentacotripeptide-repeat region of PRORP domain-containing protein n=1 Tax=Turnera subulata TaxID=218843 RepID=A0A9Q0FGG5_9ROSI|nr:hypothetical protein Tsubulata_021218 [Turnera subulata]
MALLGATKLRRSLLPSTRFFLLQYSTLQESIKAAVESKTYQQIPDLLASSSDSRRNPNPNPFSFLSSFPDRLRTQVIDEILQSLLPLRPRSRAHTVHSCLLLHTLQNPNPFPLSLAIIQRILRSGSLPVPQTKLLLSSAWLMRRSSDSVAAVLKEMESLGYRPDSGTCNYVIASLCDVDQLAEAVKVLKGMGGAGCVPDLESYGAVLSAMCSARKTVEAVETVEEMVAEMGLSPRQGTLVKVAAALRANREVKRAVKMIEFLEEEGYIVGFECYEVVLEGCVECKEFILAAKVAVGMADKGFIPYIKTRQKVVDGLAGLLTGTHCDDIADGFDLIYADDEVSQDMEANPDKELEFGFIDVSEEVEVDMKFDQPRVTISDEVVSLKKADEVVIEVSETMKTESAEAANNQLTSYMQEQKEEEETASDDRLTCNTQLMKEQKELWTKSFSHRQEFYKLCFDVYIQGCPKV